MSSLENLLINKYGVLMCTRDFAELIGTTEKRVSNGFANALPWTKPFEACRLKIGRRVHFNTASVAKVLEAIQQQALQKGATQVHRVWCAIGARAAGRMNFYAYIRRVASKFLGESFRMDACRYPIYVSVGEAHRWPNQLFVFG